MIRDFIVTGSTDIVEHIVQIIVVNKRGFLIPVYFFITFNFTYVDDFVFTGFLCRPDSKDFDFQRNAYIICDRYDKVEGITENTLGIVNMKPQQFNVQEFYNLNIKKLFPDYHNWQLQLEDKGSTQAERTILYFPQGKMDQHLSSASVAAQALARFCMRQDS
jgi:hypothetical protein